MRSNFNKILPRKAKSVRVALLAFSTMLAGATVQAGAAQAVTSTTLSCDFGKTSTALCDSGLVWDLGDKQLTNLALTMPAPGHVDFTWVDLDSTGNTYADDTWITAVFFDSPISGIDPQTPTTGSLSYTLAVTNPQWRFSSVEHDSTHTGSGVTVSKTIQGYSPTPYLTSLNGVPAGPAALGGTLINVTDNFSVTTAGTLASFVNNYTQTTESTPAPLPLLGASAAIGFSRRLRRRISGVPLS